MGKLYKAHLLEGNRGAMMGIRRLRSWHIRKSALVVLGRAGKPIEYVVFVDDAAAAGATRIAPCP